MRGFLLCPFLVWFLVGIFAVFRRRCGDSSRYAFAPPRPVPTVGRPLIPLWKMMLMRQWRKRRSRSPS
uniref:Putative secreted protein n=1 Tax=Anopheles darlingi TaxID=43151 RepID=A0A2M4DBB0_ANODA